MTDGRQAYDPCAVQLPSFSPSAVRKVALAAVVCYALLVVTGGAVRLSGSGLGCPDWPSCFQHQLTASSSFHPMVEFLNRLVSVAVSVLSVAAFAVTWLREPRRRDLLWPAGGLVVGVAAQVVLGGLVVLFKLNPYLVALHFALTIVVLVDAIVLYHRAGSPQTAPEALVGRDLVRLARVLLVVLAALTLLGTAVTGAGPHAGGKGAQRIPVAFRDIAEAHSTVALFLIGLTLAAQFAFRQARAPGTVMRRCRLLLEVMVVQGVIGYVQYFLHDSPAVVELHLVGVMMLWIVAVGFYLSLHRHPQAAMTVQAPGSEAEPRREAAGSPGAEEVQSPGPLPGPPGTERRTPAWPVPVGGPGP
jgi:heme a synthase